MPASDTQFFLPPADVVQTWNTKRLLPNVLLSQYTPFSILFLIDDASQGLDLRTNNNGPDDILFGTPTDTAFDVTTRILNNPENYKSLEGGQFNSQTSQNIVASTK